MKSDIEVVGGVPQKVYKIPLKDIPEKQFEGIEIPKFLERIIIGPNDHQRVLGHAFTELLVEAGCGDGGECIYYSGIPLR